MPEVTPQQKNSSSLAWLHGTCEEHDEYAAKHPHRRYRRGSNRCKLCGHRPISRLDALMMERIGEYLKQAAEPMLKFQQFYKKTYDLYRGIK